MAKLACKSVCVCLQLFPVAVFQRYSCVPMASSSSGNHEKAGLPTWKTQKGLGKGCGLLVHKVMPLGKQGRGRVRGAPISLWQEAPRLSSRVCVCRRAALVRRPPPSCSRSSQRGPRSTGPRNLMTGTGKALSEGEQNAESTERSRSAFLSPCSFQGNMAETPAVR